MLLELPNFKHFNIFVFINHSQGEFLMPDETQGEVKAYREKYWNELDADGKIERLALRLITALDKVDDLQNLNHRFQRHIHTADGTPAIPINRDQIFGEFPRRKGGHGLRKWN